MSGVLEPIVSEEKWEFSTPPGSPEKLKQQMKAVFEPLATETCDLLLPDKPIQAKLEESEENEEFKSPPR